MGCCCGKKKAPKKDEEEERKRKEEEEEEKKRLEEEEAEREEARKREEEEQRLEEERKRLAEEAEKRKTAETSSSPEARHSKHGAAGKVSGSKDGEDWDRLSDELLKEMYSHTEQSMEGGHGQLCKEPCRYCAAHELERQALKNDDGTLRLYKPSRPGEATLRTLCPNINPENSETLVMPAFVPGLPGLRTGNAGHDLATSPVGPKDAGDTQLVETSTALERSPMKEKRGLFACAC